MKTQPTATLDCLLDPQDDGEVDGDMFDASLGRASPLEAIEPDALIAWAEVARD